MTYKVFKQSGLCHFWGEDMSEEQAQQSGYLSDEMG